MNHFPSYFSISTLSQVISLGLNFLTDSHECVCAHVCARVCVCVRIFVRVCFSISDILEWALKMNFLS